ncbi:MAG: type II secretion system protein N, partial [Burkholderiaceae bacterium]
GGASRWGARLAALLLWAAAGASAVFWALKFGTPASMPPATPVASLSSGVSAPAADAEALARLLGAQAATSAASAAAAAPAASALQGRLVLKGVVAARSQREGAALISVDGKPPQTFRVGARIDDAVMLQSVGARTAVIAADARGPALITLELPKPPQ